MYAVSLMNTSGIKLNDSSARGQRILLSNLDQEGYFYSFLSYLDVSTKVASLDDSG